MSGSPFALAPFKAPFGYNLTPAGVFAIPEGESKHSEILCGPLAVSRLLRNGKNDNWAFEAIWLDGDGNLHRANIPCSWVAKASSELIELLASGGLRLGPGKERKIANYLSGFYGNLARARTVAQVGWIETPGASLAYMYPGERGLISPKNTSVSFGENIVFMPENNDYQSFKDFKSSGTLEEWQRYIAEPCKGNPLLIFSILNGFLPVLLNASEMDGGGFHFYGPSSHGKTIAQQVAMSVWGCGADPAEDPGNSGIERWNTTINGLEAVAAIRNDGPLLLDEIGTSGIDKNFGKAVYDLCGGRGKVALERNRSMAKKREWRTWIISTGEVSLRQKIEQAGQEAHAGQMNRILDIPISQGTIENGHGQPHHEFARNLKTNCGQFYGVGAIAFIQKLVDSYDSESLKATLKQVLDEAEDALTPPNLIPEARRGLRRFALARVAGYLAAGWEILPFTFEEVIQAVRIARDAWLTEIEEGLSDGNRGLANIAEFIQRNRSRFRSIANDQISIPNLAGYVDELNHRFCFTVHGFKEACGGINPKIVLRELRKQGLLFQNNKENGKYRDKSKHYVAGYNALPGKKDARISLYAISSEILTGTDGTSGRDSDNHPPEGTQTILLP